MIKKFSKLALPVKASIAFLIVNIIQKAWAFLSTPIFTRLLLPEQYGIVATYYSYLELFGIIAMFCLQGGVFNNGMVEYSDKRNEFSFSMLVLSNIITTVSFMIVLTIYPLLNCQLGLGMPLLILMFSYFYLQPAFGFWSSKQRYEYEYKYLSIYSILIAIVPTTLSIILVYNVGCSDRVYARLFGYEGILVLFYFVFYIHLAKKAKFKLYTSFWKSALSFNIVLIPHYLSVYILSSSDRIMIANMVSDEAAGIYSLGYSVGLVLIAFWTAINNSLIPFTYENCKHGKFKSISSITSKIVILFGACCFMLILVTPEFLNFLAPPSYHDALSLIPPIVGGMFFLALYNIFANIVYYYRKPKYVMIGSVLAAILNIVLNYILLPIYGFTIAAYTTLFCYMFQALIDFYAMKKILGHNIYPVKILLLCSIAIFTLSTIGNVFYNYTIIRYSFIIILLTFMYFKRKQIINIMR